MSATPSPTHLPIHLDTLEPDQLKWLAAKSQQTGKPVDLVIFDLIAAHTRKDGFPMTKAGAETESTQP